MLLGMKNVELALILLLSLSGQSDLMAQDIQGGQSSARSIDTCGFRERQVELNATHSKVVAKIGELDLRIHYAPGSENLALVTLSKRGRILQTARIRDANMPYDSVLISPDNKSFAITWSDAGGAGNWDVRVFRLTNDGRLVDDRSAIKNVEQAFSSRNRCDPWNQPIGPANNFNAIGWLDNDLLWMTGSIYPDSRCHNMGYSEGYVVRVSSGKIVAHLSEAELLQAYKTCGREIPLPH